MLSDRIKVDFILFSKFDEYSTTVFGVKIGVNSYIFGIVIDFYLIFISYFPSTCFSP